ncbi:MAG TPA: SPOR domain-containing protein [Novosphingobium sp.]|nr:SPOR domain-containing protein [Novosphingobium sp.]
MTSRPKAQSPMFARLFIRRAWARLSAGAAGCLLLATPALADVKAGVDAWWRGDQATRQGDNATAAREFATAVREWQPLADKGDADAQFNLAQAYKLGRGAPQDLTRAELLYAKAASQGHMQAADNYGLLLFQRGQHEAALPYVKTAAERGDPRAQYLLGIAHFNAENVPKDWVRAYALESLAQQAGLPQAKAALAQMDRYIPLEERQKGISLATEMAAQAEANRQRQLANADLGGKGGMSVSLPDEGRGTASTAPAMPSGMAGHLAAAPTRPASAPASGNPMQTAGADFARREAPAPQAPKQPRTDAKPVHLAKADMPARTDARAGISSKPEPKAKAEAKPEAKPKPEARAKPAPAGGPYKLQLGAFGVASNVDAQWKRAKAFAEVAGHPRADVPTGKVTRLMATGYAEEPAQAACRKLVAAGITCIVVRD